MYQPSSPDTVALLKKDYGRSYSDFPLFLAESHEEDEVVG
jgi:hypothetical protein